MITMHTPTGGIAWVIFRMLLQIQEQGKVKDITWPIDHEGRDFQFLRIQEQEKG